MSATAALLAEAHSEESGGGFNWETAYPIIPHPGELIFGFIAFAILYLVVWKKVVPRLETMFAQRREQIEGGIERAERAQAEADAARAEYQQQAADARAEADKARAEGETLRKAADDRANELAARLAKLEAQPANGGPVLKGGELSKSADMGDGAGETPEQALEREATRLGELQKRDPSGNLAAVELMKMVHRRGGTPIDPRQQA